MSRTRSDRNLDLQGYHDGELRGLARWRFERRLRREPALRRELEGLARLGVWLRESEGEAPGPDLWDRIALRLPAADARAAEAARGQAPGWGWRGPAGALATAAAVVAAVWLGSFRAPAPVDPVVRWMDSGGRPVMVLEGDAEAKVTIIWTFDEAATGAARGGRRDFV